MKSLLLALALLFPTISFAVDPWADSVAEFVPGEPVGASVDDPAYGLGEPTRVTAPDTSFGGATTPFNAAFGAGELFSLGEGASVTYEFDEPVTDDPLNPFGIDLLVFGNSFLGLDFAAGVATAGVFSEGGVIEVSGNGVDFVEVSGVEADGLFPTAGYQDITEPFPSGAGSVPTDFTLPVDPSLTVDDLAGLDTAGLLDAYAGSGGGAGVDLASVGLAEISFVRITNPVGSGVTPEIDALADVRAVPEPGALAVTLAMLAVAASRRFAVRV